MLTATAVLALHLTLTPWRAPCPRGPDAVCGVPLAVLGGNFETDLTLGGELQPGQATREARDFVTPAGVKGRITFYRVRPMVTTGMPEYVQLRLDLLAPVQATCAESVRVRSPFETPPMICASVKANEGGPAEQWGATLTVKPNPN